MPTCAPKKSSVLWHWENYSSNRCYNGCKRLNQDQFYEGELFRARIHGQGIYKWNEVGVYEGGFYSNCKEGYASLSFPDGSYFEGLFIKNQPFGPGILTHPNGRQDAGFWVGRKLVRLSRAVDFIVPRLAPTSAAKIKLLQFRRLIPLDEKHVDSATDILRKHGCLHHISSPYSSLTFDERSIFFDKEIFERTYFRDVRDLSKEFARSPRDWETPIKAIEAEEGEKEGNGAEEIPIHCTCLQDVFDVDFRDADETDVCDRESTTGEFEMGILCYFTKFGTIGLGERSDNGGDLNEEGKQAEEETKKKSKIVSWNRSELCTEILKQIFRYRAFEEKLSFNLGKLMLGARTAFRRTGEKEKQSLHFLKMCSIGPPRIIKELLCNHEISEELMDARGNNCLMFAAATDQHEIIDILLDHGVDVNTFNDESLTPLNLCLLRRLACTNRISNWESAFLPKEIDKTLEDFSEVEDWQSLQSIPSLDRIFGDGMSINDSKSLIFGNRPLSPLPPPSASKTPIKGIHSRRSRHLSEANDFSSVSHITILNMPKSPGSYNLILRDWNEEIYSPVKSGNVSIRQYKEPLKEAESGEPKNTEKIIPKSNRREEFEKSLETSEPEQYFFGFSFEKNPKAENGKKAISAKQSKDKSNRAKEKDEVEGTTLLDVPVDKEMAKKIANIDKTILKLLRRGADPNISEVPKPTIHLGVYTRDIDVVNNLLSHGASPDCQLYSNEGLLTPLHVIVLQKSSAECVAICQLLLKFGANPERETAPEFFICQEEKESLVSDGGRTPLQLLCMRPDLEYADVNDNLIQISLMLANVSNKKRFYRGHSYLTLAMLQGNLKLLKALLDSKYFDPNDILGNDRGTALYVLVSTELQRKTNYETSIKMCDLLIEGGGNPWKKFKTPAKLLGTCIDYGYREILTEKEARKTNSRGKKSAGKEKTGKDYLIDHEKVVKYLEGMKKPEKRRRKRRTGNFEEGEEEMAEEQEEVGGPALEKGRMEIKIKDGEREEYEKKRKVVISHESEDRKESVKSDRAETNKGKDQKVKGGFKEGEKPGGKNKADLYGEKIKKESNKKREKKTDLEGKKNGRAQKGEKAKKEKGKERKNGKKKKGTNEGFKKEEKTTVRHTESHKLKRKEEGQGKMDSNSFKLGKSSIKTLSEKYLACRSETFPEKLRQTLLRMYGSCVDIDVNEFLVPYVVLRDGELYYRFRGTATDQKEQYSLI